MVGVTEELDEAAMLEEGPDVMPEVMPDVPFESKTARLADTTELIEEIWALSRFTVKESASPSVCTGGREKDTDDDLADELEDTDELEADVTVDDSSVDVEDLSSSSSSSDNSSRPEKSASMAPKSGVVPGGTSMSFAKSLAILIAQPASPSKSPARFLMPLKRSLLNLSPEPPPQAFTLGGSVPPRFVKAATALMLKS
ncbi:hypothetical protein MMC28_003287 [Mycoblastus sanguinarius]|nr:hypothetical protein [Mycoblastus sanguinarius]